MEGTDMDSTLWRNLPPDVLEKILAKLPVPSLMSFSRVCKRWENLIQSPGFARRCDSVKPIVFCHYPGNSKASGVLAKNKKARSFLAFPCTKTNTWEKHILEFASEPVTLIAADQGLMCFRPEGKHSTLLIYNPLTRQFRRVRVPGKSREGTDPEMLVGLSVNPDTGSYKLVVGFIELNIQEGEDEEEESRGTHIYDSQSSLWTSSYVYPSFPFPEDEFGDWDDSTQWYPHVSVHCGGNFYWIIEEKYDAIGTHFFRFLVKYDTKLNIWIVSKPDLPYEPYVREEDFPGCLPKSLPYARFVKPLNLRSYHGGSELPQWNFHLAADMGTLCVTLFDSLIGKDSYSGEFSFVIPEVKVIDSELVRKLVDHADATAPYLPTKAIAQNGTWYVNLPPYSIPKLQTFVATFRAFP
ncbi:hypothetical protein R1sor_026631 [Riccia sorocarpa]|uniref:F-box domain-containing protein n=1 Tax=Riccia sorocarpa TaxID=122646 RepID=A0ABD3GBY8_9MARC